MNLFILDTDPYKAASLVCDQHCVSQTNETWQMLSWTVKDKVPNPVMGSFSYFLTHGHHPCTKWVNENQSNYEWASMHLDGLLLEYDKRFPGNYFNWKSHRLFIMYCYHYKQFLPEGPLTPFVQCMPEEYRRPDPVEAYWLFYNAEKRFARWNHSTTPDRWIYKI